MKHDVDIINDMENARIRAGVTVFDLCDAAGILPDTYSKMKLRVIRDNKPVSQKVIGPIFKELVKLGVWNND